MGFSLERFFEELLELLDDSAKNDAGDAASDLRRIEELVKQEQKYARECGQIRCRITQS